MNYIETATATEAYRQHCEDRIAVFADDQRTVIVVADGAGGTGSGDLAASTVAHVVKREFAAVNRADEWVATLKQTDERLSMGETTAVVVDIRPYGIAGASVGDSQAWIIIDGNVENLTQHQNCKPLLGSHQATPVPFTHGPLQGTLLVGTDGFFNYAKKQAITQMVAQNEFCSLPRVGINLVRLPSGELWDDTAIVAARIRPKLPTRKRYSI